MIFAASVPMDNATIVIIPATTAPILLNVSLFIYFFILLTLSGIGCRFLSRWQRDA